MNEINRELYFYLSRIYFNKLVFLKFKKWVEINRRGTRTDSEHGSHGCILWVEGFIKLWITGADKSLQKSRRRHHLNHVMGKMFGDPYSARDHYMFHFSKKIQIAKMKISLLYQEIDIISCQFSQTKSALNCSTNEENLVLNYFANENQ